MTYELETLITEKKNPETTEIDMVSTLEIVTMLNREDSKVAACVAQVLPEIAEAVELIVAQLSKGGRLFYVGCGTSGRLAVCDAAECPPTFGTDPQMVQALIGGGPDALLCAVEGSEDDLEAGSRLLDEHGITETDVVVGIATSGRTPFVLGAIEECSRRGVPTVGLCNNYDSRMRDKVNICIEAVAGPEAIMGSTRLKAGTAQKMILNMLSTTAMVRLGKVYGNLMVDLQPTNHKLEVRCRRIIMLATGVEEETAQELFLASGGDCKTAILMEVLQVDRVAAQRLLEQSDGFVRKAIETGLKEK